MAITLIGKDQEVLAFASFYDHPSVNNLMQSQWESWLHTNYTIPLANVSMHAGQNPPDCTVLQPLNTLFLRLFVAKDGFSQDALAELLK